MLVNMFFQIVNSFLDLLSKDIKRNLTYKYFVSWKVLSYILYYFLYISDLAFIIG
jgi:hypothetical protein